MFELLRDLDSRAARLARAAIVPFAILLTAFDPQWALLMECWHKR